VKEQEEFIGSVTKKEARDMCEEYIPELEGVIDGTTPVRNRNPREWGDEKKAKFRFGTISDVGFL
jgi:hypothetical protein